MIITNENYKDNDSVYVDLDAAYHVIDDLNREIAEQESQLTEAAEILEDLINILGGRNCDCGGYILCPVCRAVKFVDDNFESGED